MLTMFPFVKLWNIPTIGVQNDRISWLIPIQTVNQMATLYNTELSPLYGLKFRFKSRLPSTGMGLESVSVNINKPLKCEVLQV